MNRPKLVKTNAFNHKTNSVGTVIPTGHAVDDLAGVLQNINNYYTTQSRRILFARGNGGITTYGGALTSEIIARWRWNDTWTPGTQYVIHVIGSCSNWGAATSSPTITLNGSSPQITIFPDGQIRAYSMVVANTVTDAAKTAYLTLDQADATTSIEINAIVVAEVSDPQSAPVSVIPAAGEPITSRHVEQGREALYEAFTLRDPPVFWFSSDLESACPTLAGSTTSGMCFTTAGYLNPCDFSSSAWGSGTPGFIVPVKNLGRGHLTDSCKIRVAAYGRLGAAADSGELRFETSSDSQVLSFTTTSYAWQTATLTLDTSQWTEKVDILGKITGSAVRLQVVAICCWIEWA